MSVSKYDIIEYNGEKHSIIEWCAIKGLSLSTLCNRIRNGNSIEEALNKKPMNTAAKKHREKRLDANCVDCVYSVWLYPPNMERFCGCDYMGITGKRRPCPYGAGCTVKKKKKKPRRVITPWG